MNLTELKMVIIFLYEFYHINNITYQQYIDNFLDNPTYQLYAKTSRNRDLYSNLLNLLGFIPKIHNLVLYIPSGGNRSNDPDNLVVKYNSDNCGVYIYEADLYLTIKLHFISFDSNFKSKYQWCTHIFSKLQSSKVISFTFTSKQIQIDFDLTKLNILSNQIVWISLFKTLIRNPKTIYQQLIIENTPLYPIQLLIKNKWEINLNKSYLNLSTLQIINSYIKDIRWNKNKSYLLLLHRLSNTNNLTRFYSLLFILDKYLYNKILNYI